MEDKLESSTWSIWQYFSYFGLALAILGGVCGAIGTILKDRHQIAQSAQLRIEADSKQKKLEDMLQPIANLAMQKFPGLPQEEALKKLQSELKELQSKTATIEKNIAPRELTDLEYGEVAKKLGLIPNLKIDLMAVNDAESNSFMHRILETLMANRLKIHSVTETTQMFGTPRGIFFLVKTTELGTALQPVQKVFQQAGLDVKIEVQNKIPDPTLVYFVVGIK